jgi:hypothetical protein
MVFQLDLQRLLSDVNAVTSSLQTQLDAANREIARLKAEHPEPAKPAEK